MSSSATSPAANNLEGLQQFVAGLSGSEKAYYLKFSKRHGSASTAHLRLFALLTSGLASTDAQLQKKLGIRSGSQFSALKAHLLSDLLDALAFMRRRESPERLLHTQLAQLEELLARDATGLAQKLHAKTLALAAEHEAHDAVIRLLQISPHLAPSASWQRQKAALANIAALHDAALARRARAVAARRLHSALESLRKDAMLRFTEEQAREVEAFERQVEGISIGTTGEALTDAYRAASLAVCRYMLLDFDAARDCSMHAVRTFELHSWFFTGNSPLFLSAVSILLYADFARKDIIAAEAHLAWASCLADEHLPDRARKIFSTIHFNTRLKILHKQTDYAGVETLICREANDILLTAGAALPADECLNLQSSICISYFVLRDYEKAEDLLLSIKEANHTAQREDVLYFSILFHLLILFERRAWHQLHAATDAAYHHLYARKKLRPFEKDLMLFLRKLPALRSGARMAHIETFLLQLEQYKTDPVKALFFLYFDYYGWLRSKVFGLDYQDYRRRELAGELAPVSAAAIA